MYKIRQLCNKCVLLQSNEQWSKTRKTQNINIFTFFFLYVVPVSYNQNFLLPFYLHFFYKRSFLFCLTVCTPVTPSSFSFHAFTQLLNASIAFLILVTLLYWVFGLKVFLCICKFSINYFLNRHSQYHLRLYYVRITCLLCYFEQVYGLCIQNWEYINKDFTCWIIVRQSL